MAIFSRQKSQSSWRYCQSPAPFDNLDDDDDDLPQKREKKLLLNVSKKSIVKRSLLKYLFSLDSLFMAHDCYVDT